MQIVEKLKTVTEEPQKLSADGDNNFTESIIGEEVRSDEEPVDNAGVSRETEEPEGGVEVPEEEPQQQEEVEGEEPKPKPKAEQKPVETKDEQKPALKDDEVIMKKVDLEEYEKLKALAPHWQRFADDPLAFVKELGIPVKDSQENYDKEYLEGTTKIRSKYGEDFEIDPTQLANPMSDSARYLKEINDLQFSLQMKHKNDSQKFSDPIKRKEQIWVGGERDIKQVIANTMKEYNVNEDALLPAFRKIAEITKTTDIDELKISLAKELIPLYIKSEKGLRSQTIVKKVEEQIAAETKGKVTPTPTGQKSQNRPQTNIINPFSDSGEGMFKKI